MWIATGPCLRMDGDTNFSIEGLRSAQRQGRGTHERWVSIPMQSWLPTRNSVKSSRLAPSRMPRTVIMVPPHNALVDGERPLIWT